MVTVVMLRTSQQLGST